MTITLPSPATVLTINPADFRDFYRWDIDTTGWAFKDSVVAGEKRFDDMTITLPSPATVLTINPADFNLVNVMPTELGGQLTAAPNKVQQVSYPASLGFGSILKGVSALDAALHAATGPVIVFGYSEGATVATVWLIQNGGSSLIGNVTFVLIGNPNRITGMYHALAPHTTTVEWMTTPTDTPYPVFDIARRKDGWANWANLGIVAAGLGMYATHDDYTKVSLNNPANTVSHGGTTTYVEAD